MAGLAVRTGSPSGDLVGSLGCSESRSGTGGLCLRLLPEELAANGLQLLLGGTAPEAKVPYLVKALGPDVLEKASQELLSRKPHRAPMSALSVAILEEDVGRGDLENAMVGECRAMNISREIAEDAVGAVFRGVDVNDPRGAEDRPRKVESVDLGAHEGHQLGSEHFGKDFVGSEPGSVDAAPLSLFIDDAGGDEAVDVRVELECAGPGVEDGHDADVAAGVAWVAGDLEERARSGGDERAIEDALMLANDAA